MFSEASALPSVRDSRFCANDPTNIEGPYVDKNGVVDVTDLIAMVAAWGPCPAETTRAMRPASIAS